MYGEHVHQAVLDAGDKQSGITIHLVDEQYDHGKTIFQASIDVNPGETAQTLANRIHILEHEHYPSVIAKWVE
jgi:phosphoribosylglycinamide formyltransferase-1